MIDGGVRALKQMDTRCTAGCAGMEVRSWSATTPRALWSMACARFRSAPIASAAISERKRQVCQCVRVMLFGNLILVYPLAADLSNWTKVLRRKKHGQSPIYICTSHHQLSSIRSILHLQVCPCVWWRRTHVLCAVLFTPFITRPREDRAGREGV